MCTVACTYTYDVGSDLAVCVTDALLQPVREMEQATHWRTVKVETIGREDSVMYIPCGAEEGVNVPCEGDEQGVKECSLHELPPHQVRTVCMYVCMYYTYVCMYVRMYRCIRGRCVLQT